MGRYGIDYYGVGKYGPVTPVEFDASPFVALPVGYGQIRLTWRSPDGAWDEIRLVRNSYGFPLDPDDGDLVYGASQSLDDQFYLDAPSFFGALQPGRTYYYSLFVLQTGTTNWLRAGNAYGISVKNFGTFEKMYNYLPIVYRQVGQYDYTSDRENEDLKDFLRLFAFEYDLEKTFAMNLMYSYDTSFVDGRYIPQLMKQLGLNFEPEIGLKQSRVLLRNAMKIYKTKGSRDGLITYLKAFTGYDLDLKNGKNLLLDKNCSSFEETTGFWTATGATLNQAGNGTYGISAYTEPLSPPSYPNKTKGFLRVVSTVANNITMNCGDSAPITRGVPVTAGETYTFSIYAQAATTARTTTLSIKWYNSRGTYLSTSTGTGVSVTTSVWGTRPTVSGLAPATATFAVPVISIASAAVGNTFYFDAAQFEKSNSVTYFEEARAVKITFKANRINEFKNPNFESNTQWTATGGNLLTASSISPSIPTKLADALVLRPTAVGTLAKVNSEQVAVSAPLPDFYTVSMHVRFLNEGANPTANDTVTLKVRWYNSSNTLLQTDTGLTAAASTTAWSHLVSVAYAPANAAYGIASVEWTPAASTSVSLIVDEAMFERSAFLNEYFDGGTGVSSLDNLFWEGTVNASRSHLYSNKTIIETRLLTDIENYLPMGTSYQLFFAQPN